jgi:hypothetical protein
MKFDRRTRYASTAAAARDATPMPGKHTLTEDLAVQRHEPQAPPSPGEGTSTSEAMAPTAANDRISTRAPASSARSAIDGRIPIQTLFGRRAGDDAAARGPTPRSAGVPLPESVRATMETALDSSFATVRIHQDEQAQALGARALARGEDLFFAPGEYDPTSPRGKELLAHELTHVVQQREGRASVARTKGATWLADDPTLEAEADAAAKLGAASAARSTRPDATPSKPAVVQYKLWKDDRELKGDFDKTEDFTVHDLKEGDQLTEMDADSPFFKQRFQFVKAMEQNGGIIVRQITEDLTGACYIYDPKTGGYEEHTAIVAGEKKRKHEQSPPRKVNERQARVGGLKKRRQSEGEHDLAPDGGGSEQTGRSVGFEWEVDQLHLTEVTKADDPKVPAQLPSKAVAFHKGGVRLEVDSGHGEFVTEPADTIAQLQAQLAVMSEIVAALRTGQPIFLSAPGDIVHTDHDKRGEVWMPKGEWIQAKLNGKTMSGLPQATSGIDNDQEALLEALFSSTELLPNRERKSWETDLTRASETANKAENPKVQTLVLAVEYLIAACRSGASDAQDGPKTWMPLMLRTDFRSMFLALEDHEQREFREWTNSPERPRNEFLCPGGYRANSGHEKGPTIGAWLDSICDGRKDRNKERHADKDLMSPPPGFEQHLTDQAKAADRDGNQPVAVPIPYAMGLMGLDGDLIVGERRQITSQAGFLSGKVTFEEFCERALDFAKSVGIAEPVAPKGEAEQTAERGTDRRRGWYQQLCKEAGTTAVKDGKQMKNMNHVYRQGMVDFASTIDVRNAKLGGTRRALADAGDVAEEQGIEPPDLELQDRKEEENTKIDGTGQEDRMEL